MGFSGGCFSGEGLRRVLMAAASVNFSRVLEPPLLDRYEELLVEFLVAVMEKEEETLASFLCTGASL